MKKYKILSLILLLISSTAFSNKTDYGSIKVIKINSVYDGDTFRADLESTHPILSKNIPIRVAGIDTPEIRGKCDREKALAKLARDFTRSFLISSKQIELRNIKRGKYFRIVADVYGDNISLTESLIQARLGYRYEGKTKHSFC
ncbi:MAG: thermonuclease family protein [Pseudoalteromonas sp.]|uniref:thermonuclease family protein n=1 Tax=Pseudoalteromonas sp. TaxID=53249 RepID=UPI0025D39E88|nr:thermonuclease family protein [Pseudoalteromonas sp.]MCH2089503.1 thermonuclease family protein [Pseudoalteromonas sp.]